MEATYLITTTTSADALTWAAVQARTWGVRTPHLNAWVRRGSQLLGGSDGRLVLCWDPDQRLFSIDVFRGERRVFGMDDLL